MTTFDLWPIPLGGGAWGAGTNMWHPETPASYESLPALLTTQIPTLWIHTFGGRGHGGALILDRCRAFDLFASVNAHLCLYYTLQMMGWWESHINVLFGIAFTLKPNKTLTTWIKFFHLWSKMFQIGNLYVGQLCVLSAQPQERRGGQGTAAIQCLAPFPQSWAHRSYILSKRSKAMSDLWFSERKKMSVERWANCQKKSSHIAQSDRSI